MAKLRNAIVGGAALIIAMTLSSPAQANSVDYDNARPADSPATQAYPPNCEEAVDYAIISRGEACFHRNGDKFEVWDNESDGLRVVVEWYTDYGREGECHHTGGAGAELWCNYDMREGGELKFRVVTRNGANPPNHHESVVSRWLAIG
ncbi:hypothetical protein [Streptomyces sp. MP131-18]|uniref:hypothetical protein n=1 Tax=Streptomyces sp. MP131-18 TaxID=1857892 RepID=UPI0009CEC320|nr:hypothetical protein [Streptomyces sp. MP131-18]ONK09572.1 hypothetical protein STBA_02720 [Streptomyces sp. MP131-18]